jgi:hypothetical protein
MQPASSAHTLSFRVDGDGLAEQLREFWTHYKPDLAVDILLGGGLKRKHVREFFAGKLTFTPDGQGVVKANLPALPSPQDTMERLGAYYELQFAEYAEACAKAANPERNHLHGCVDVGVYTSKIVARVSVAAEDADELRQKANATYQRLQKLARLLKLVNPVEAIPDAAPDFLRLYAQGIQARAERLDALEAAAGIAPAKRTSRPYQAPVEEQAPEPSSMAHSVVQHGYLSPEGLFYACSFQAHTWLAPLLKKKYYPGPLGADEPWDEQRLLDSKGWAKLSSGRLYHFSPASMRLTPQQLEVVLSWRELQDSETIDFNGMDWKLSDFLTFQAQ